jgi:hypothetical protein
VRFWIPTVMIAAAVLSHINIISRLFMWQVAHALVFDTHARACRLYTVMQCYAVGSHGLLANCAALPYWR